MPPIYKIFINETPLVIAEKDYIPAKEIYVEPNVDFEKDIPGFINRIFEGEYPSGILVRVDSVDETIARIRNQITLVIAAGGMVLTANDELLMIFRRGKWDLPKGKLDPGEDLENAAIREVMEETGVKGLNIIQDIGVMDYVYRIKHKIFLKEIHWYKMHTNNKNALSPQKDEGITQAEWVKRSDIPEKMKNTYASVRELVLSQPLLRR